MALELAALSNNGMDALLRVPLNEDRALSASIIELNHRFFSPAMPSLVTVNQFQSAQGHPFAMRVERTPRILAL
jgi:hypothetical protein